MRIWPWSKFKELEIRIADMERQFAVEYDPESGRVTKTLADVPIEDRAELRKKSKFRRGSWDQRRAWLENSDGGRRLGVLK